MPLGTGTGAAARIDAATRWLCRRLAACAAVALAAIFALVMAGVVMRYVIGTPFRFTEELSGLLLAMSVILVVPMTLAEDSNIRVTLLSERLGGAAAGAVRLLAGAIVVLFFAVFAGEAWKSYELAVRFAEKSEQARLSLAPWKLATAALFGLSAAVALWRALRPPPKSDAPAG
jgi:TRAP-type C4-dicarboxylate transport system permease small subunit